MNLMTTGRTTRLRIGSEDTEVVILSSRINIKNKKTSNQKICHRYGSHEGLEKDIAVMCLYLQRSESCKPPYSL